MFTSSKDQEQAKKLRSKEDISGQSSDSVSDEMRFTPAAAAAGAGAGAERLGHLVTRTGERLPTPRVALLTAAGSVPHVTRAVLERACPEPQLLLCPLSTCLHAERGARALGAGLAAFCASRPQDAWLVTAEDASVPVRDGHFRGDAVPLWTRHGKVLLHADRYMDVMETFRPDAYAALADTRALPGASRKRLARAAQRSAGMLETCLRRHRASPALSADSAILGVVTGWGCAEALERSVASVAQHARELAGVLLAPAAAPTAAPADLPPELPGVLERLEECGARVAAGRWSPACALALVGLGCDVVDASAAARLADAGRALVFPLRACDAGGDSDHAPTVLDMDDPVYKEALVPLVAGCACAACARHTRAYVHHLRTTRELLAPLLLTIHNLHHYSALLAEARRHIAAGTFPAYREFIGHQHARYTLQHGADCADTPPPAPAPAHRPAGADCADTPPPVPAHCPTSDVGS